MIGGKVRCSRPGCARTHQLPGGTRCPACREEARRRTAAGWATVHWPGEDELGKVEDVRRYSVALQLPSRNEPLLFVRLGGGVLWRQADDLLEAPSVHITFGEGLPCD